MANVLWADVIDPATLSGFARESLDDYEAKQGSLEQFLPNTTVNDISVRFDVNEYGLTETAEFRAYDAEASHSRETGSKGVRLDLPAIGNVRTIDEYRQLRLRNAGNGAMEAAILKATVGVVRAVADRMELLRGEVLSTGKATVDDEKFYFSDSFGRPAEHDVVAPVLWTANTTASRIDQLLKFNSVYSDTNGHGAGVMVMSDAAFAAFRLGNEFVSTLTGRPLPADQINALLVSEGLPPIQLFNRKVKYRKGNTSTVKPVLDPKKVLLLPSDPTELGYTYWGETLTATETDFGLAAGENSAGIVVGAYRNSTPPVIASVISDAIGMPVLGNAAKSFAATVLA